jgi:hypothetical protein
MKIIKFIQKQILDIRGGGFDVLISKMGLVQKKICNKLFNVILQSTDIIYIKSSEINTASYSLSKVIRNEFWKVGYQKINFIDNDFLKNLSLSVEEISKKNFFKEEDNLSIESLEQLVKNIFIVSPPSNLFRDYIYIKDPLKTVPGLQDFVINKIIPIAQNLMGSHVSVENVQIYKTSVSEHVLINENYHLDGDVKKSLKIMFYLTNCGKDNGPFAIKKNQNEFIWIGDTGEGLAFAASQFLHKGSRPTKGIRWVLNMKIYPRILSSGVEQAGSSYLNACRRLCLFFPMRSR